MMRPHERRQIEEGQEGFTLVELLMSAGLMIFLVTGLATVNYGVLSRRWKSREAASRTMEVLRTAKWLAISENQEYGVSFDRPSSLKHWQAQILKRGPDSWVPAEAPRNLPDAVAVLAITGPAIKEFNPDGTSSTGSVILSCRDGHSYRISLTAATGRIRMYRDGEG